LFPLRDTQPRWKTPYVVIAIIALNVIVFFIELGHSPNDVRFVNLLPWYEEFGKLPPWTKASAFFRIFGARADRFPISERDYFIIQWGLVPAEFWSGKDLPPTIPIPIFFVVLTSMFLHGGWFHLIGNMWYLWLFGDNVEWAMGSARFALFYILCGLGAAFAQMAVAPGSMVPMVGASGAISGVMGAYLVLFPWSRILTLVPFFFFYYFMELPAILFLGLWFLIQLFSALGSISMIDLGGVAWFAHLGGFITGALLVFPFKKRWVTPGLVRWWRARRYYRPPWGWWP